jgi:hypothetical protein
VADLVEYGEAAEAVTVRHLTCQTIRGWLTNVGFDQLTRTAVASGEQFDRCRSSVLSWKFANKIFLCLRGFHQRSWPKQMAWANRC